MAGTTQNGRTELTLPSVLKVGYRKCGACNGLKPEKGIGDDGRCLDCRLAPIINSQPRLSSTQRAKMRPKQTAYTEDYD